MKPLAIDLFCGLGGWAEGLLAEQWDCIGFDVERHEYALPETIDRDEGGAKEMKPVAKQGWSQGCAVSMGMEGATARPRTRLARYPAQLVLQDVLTLDGAQFRDADLIVASPPCQEFSYMAMPWSRAKAKIVEIEACPTQWLRLCALFDACFRIQREACAASGRHIPLIVENVRGAQRWVGRSRWNFGSFHLWGDVPALMPMTVKGGGLKLDKDAKTAGTQGWKLLKSCEFGPERAIKNTGSSWFNVAHNTTSGKGRNPDGRKAPSGTQWFNDGPRSPDSLASMGSKSTARKAASAMIAKIPLPLSRYIGRTFKPQAMVA